MQGDGERGWNRVGNEEEAFKKAKGRLHGEKELRLGEITGKFGLSTEASDEA